MTETLEQLYAIEHPDGFHKVGKASDAEHRKSGVQTGSPYKLELRYVLLYLEPTTATIHDRDLEDIIHSELSEYHVRGEWYDVTDDEIRKVFKEASDRFRFVDELFLHPNQTELGIKEQSQRYHDVFMESTLSDGGRNATQSLLQYLSKNNKAYESELIEYAVSDAGVTEGEAEKAYSALLKRGELYCCTADDDPEVRRT